MFHLGPVFGLPWGIVFLDQPITMALLFGAGLVIAGIGLAIGIGGSGFTLAVARIRGSCSASGGGR